MHVPYNACGRRPAEHSTTFVGTRTAAGAAMYGGGDPSWNDNLILRQVGGARLREIRRSERVHLAQHQVLGLPGKPAHAVYFPLDCLLSAAKTLHNGETVEVTTIGYEGVSGIAELLGRNTSGCSVATVVAGAAVRVDADALREAIAVDKRLQDALLQHLAASLRRMAQAVACNRLHTIEQRCARWLLESSERARSVLLPLTHEQLALILGVRRPGLTACLGRLHALGLIRQHRGCMTIVDRNALAVVACECYGTLHRDAGDDAVPDLRLGTPMHRHADIRQRENVPAET
jgi:CRP-like cAMP-binding protein